MKTLCIFIAMLSLPMLALGASPASSPEIIRKAAEHGEGLWKQIVTSNPRPETGSRGIIGYALALCEARIHPERLHRLFTLVRSMQETDPKSKNYGNLKWYWRDAGVTDANAIDFCMHDALTILARHGKWLPADAREELDAFMRLGVHGCMLHRVPTDYTNIAILNAGNLIVAGERLNLPDVAAEGRMRFDGVVLYTAAFGIHEYDSPTYYGTDLSGLLMLHTLGKEAREREQAEAMLKLFWTDIAANWLQSDEKLGGAHSRSYDYLRGVGGLDWHLWSQGWLNDHKVQNGKPPGAERREPWGDQWMAPAEIVALRDSPLPRFVEQRWGPLSPEVRYHWIASDISLSCAGHDYGTQDCPLTVDLPGDRNASRCYFIADGREDPYGKVKFATGTAKHMKALHLQPEWLGAQKNNDAVGVVAYRPNDLREPNLTRVLSHFIVRRPSDGLWLNGKPIDEVDIGRRDAKGVVQKALAVDILPMKEGQSLVLRYGSAAIAICVPWTIHTGSWPETRVALYDDGNNFDCLRLTVNHGLLDQTQLPKSGDMVHVPAIAAAFWVRVGSGLNRDADFEAWRKKIEDVRPSSDPLVRCFSNESMPKDGSPNSSSMKEKASIIDNRWGDTGAPDFVLRVNGREIGRPLLEAVEPLCSMKHGPGFWQPIELRPSGATTWKASDGLLLPAMKMVGDPDVGQCVVQEPSDSGQPAGAAFWKLHVSRTGKYYLWARVKSKDDKHGSFVCIAAGRKDILNVAQWNLRSPGKWSWQVLRNASGAPQAINLSEGELLVELKTKASGTALDRIKLTTECE